jgi:hypothetical protein
MITKKKKKKEKPGRGNHFDFLSQKLISSRVLVAHTVILATQEQRSGGSRFEAILSK